MKMFYLIFALTLVSQALPASSSEDIRSPSGTILSKVKCKSNPNNCMTKAYNKCKGPYQVYSSESHAGGILADWMPGPITYYSMLIKCGESDGRMPQFAFQGRQFRPATQCSVIGNKIVCF